MKRCNYHTHCTYCDGKNSIEEMTRAAIAKSFDVLGFSSHAPLLRNFDFLIQEEALPDYIREIRELDHKLPEIKLLAGLENDFVPGLNKPFEFYKSQYQLDYIIGGVHLVKPQQGDELWFIDGPNRQTYDDGLRDFFDHHIQKAVTCFWEQTFEMIETENFDIIAHLDKIKMHNQKRFFQEEEKWYRTLVIHAIDLIKDKNIIVEINSRGIYKKRCEDFYPSDFILSLVAKKDIPVVISSDAHQKEDTGLLYEESLQKLSSFRIENIHTFAD
jgi:histidinol-phosphatase (PHP family)